MADFTKFILLVVAVFVAIGCTGNPTNEPSVDEINKAVDRKMKAIDDDPSMSPEQKAELKKHIAGPAQSGNSAGR
jgi:hypothetical protein